MSRRQQREEAYREEAERLALLPVDEQRLAVAHIRARADAPELSTSERAAARERAAALEWLLQRLSGAIR